ncbi:alkaline phosphatase PhoX [Lewinella sp. IMCC34183]|uniref:alkaline phosphatase PhoX n=1 Tax=Lewinella sp. IMCC34183 TaxID=2248762 RepID=UPI000E21C884|nr:alkaline phosphatase PhoX [Lewinella sp. IMCC34183]
MFPRTTYLTLLLLVLASAGMSAQLQYTSVRIAATSDDAEEAGADASNPGAMDLGSSDVELTRDGNNQYIGLRFPGLQVPAGAFITNAYLQFTVDETDNLDGTVFIMVEDTDDAATFDEQPFSISSRAVVADTVSWSDIPEWTSAGDAGEDQRTPDLASLVQAVVRRDGWAAGNAISFILTGTGERTAESYDGTAAEAPMLVVEYVEAVTATFSLTASADDVERNLSSNTTDVTSSDLEITTDGSPQVVSLRFPEVNLPAGSTIGEAYVQFTVDEVTTGGNVDAMILFEQSGNPAPMGSTFDPTTRDFGLEVFWDDLPDWPTVDVAGPNQRTPDLSGSLQAVINREDWRSGNPVLIGLVDPVFLNVPGYAGNTGKRTAQSYDKSPEASAKLVVTYYPPLAYQPGDFPIAAGSSWKYLDSGVPLDGEAWFAPDYDDADWAYGDAVLGYGDDVSTEISFGNDTLNRHVTTYFRHTFEVENASQYDSLLFDVLRDDGVIVYVNGTEAFRQNMRVGPVTFDDYAQNNVAGPAEQAYFETKTGNLLTDGTNVIAVELHQSDPTSDDLAFDIKVDFTLPPLEPATYPLAKGSAWHYLDKGRSLDTVAWKDTTYARFDDAWEWGYGPLGYGGPVATQLDFGPNEADRYVTTYFRREIDIDPASLPDSIQLGLRRDDGAIVYLNGTEVLRSNLPAGDTVDYLTYATATIGGSQEEDYVTTTLLPNAFRPGVNTLAVEIHQATPNSSDLVFDLYLDDAPVVNPPALGCAEGEDHIGCFTSIAPTAQTTNLIIPDASHRFQQLHKQGTAYTIGGGTVPGNHDFTAYVPIEGSSEVGYLSINHENTPGGVSMVGLHYEAGARLWQIDSSQAVDFYNDDLVTTTRNCSGGITPWGTVITAEETGNAGDANGDGYTDVGWLVEIDPVTARVREYGNGKQEKLWAIGNISHENALILDDEVTLFTGEDGGSSALFKFVADSPRDLTSGTLYTLVLDAGLEGYEPNGTTGTWVEVPNTTKEDRNNTRALAIALGATNFNGIEDVEVNPLTGQIYFAAKGASRTYRFTDGPNGVTDFQTFVGGMSYVLNTVDGVFVEPWGGGNDNLTFDDRGNLWVLQDGGNNYIWMIRPDHTQAAPKVELFASMPVGSEPTGLTFSPDYRFGFFSVQHPSGANQPQEDATGEEIAFDASASVVFSVGAELGEQAPVVDFVSDVQQVKQGEQVTFTDLSINGVTERQWVFDGGVPAIATDSIVSVRYDGLGFYRVQLTATNGQGGDTLVREQYIEVVNSTGVDELAAATGLSVFPNPTTGQLSIRMEDTDGLDLTFSLYDVQGRMLTRLDRVSGSTGARTWTYDIARHGTANQLVVLKISTGDRVTHRLIHFSR